MNNLNIFIVLSIVAASSLFLGVAMATPAPHKITCQCQWIIHLCQWITWVT